TQMSMPCSSSDQCTANMSTCVNGTCKGYGGQTCASNGDCLSGSCMIGFCTCDSSADCRSGLQCTNTACQQVPQGACMQDIDCPYLYNCIKGKCKGTENADCTMDSDCLSSTC